MRTLCGTILAVAVVGGTFVASAAPEVSWSIMHPTGIDVKYMERVAAKAADAPRDDVFKMGENLILSRPLESMEPKSARTPDVFKSVVRKLLSAVSHTR